RARARCWRRWRRWGGARCWSGARRAGRTPCSRWCWSTLASGWWRPWRRRSWRDSRCYCAATPCCRPRPRTTCGRARSGCWRGRLDAGVLAGAFTVSTSLALSADGAYLVAGTATGEVCLWRVADRALLLAVQGHTGPVYGVALSRDGALVASGSEDGTVKLWD